MHNKPSLSARAKKEGGSFIYENGWTRKKGWTWLQPFGVPAKDQEPAVHLNFDEAQAICQFFGKRLPKDQEWTSACLSGTAGRSSTAIRQR